MERCVTNKLQHKTGNINTKHWKTGDYSSRSAGWNIQVPPVKAIWWEPPVYLLPTNHLAQAWSRPSRTRPSVTVLSNTCAGKSYTWPYTFSYVTARPYCCTWRRRTLSITSAPPARPYAGCWGLMFMCWGCPSKPMRCFCFLCSVIWKKHKRPTLVHDSSHLSRSRPLPLTGPRCLAVDSPHRSVHSKRLTEATATVQLQIYLLTEAEYKRLITKLGHMKFQRSSKASES